MSDYRPGDLLLQHGRGTQGMQSIRACTFQVETAMHELQAMQKEERVDTYCLKFQRCIQPWTSMFEPAQFECIAELFVLYSPVWQFAITWKAPPASGIQLTTSKVDQQYFAWQPGLSAWMTRVWLEDSYQRVPLACFVPADALVACMQYFLQSEGSRCSSMGWISDADWKWRFYVYPEDELSNRRESLVRPASTVSPPELEVARQLGQASFKDEPHIESLGIPDRAGVRYESGSAAEVLPLNDSTIAQVRDQLNRTDWSRATRYVSIFQEESRFSQLLGYVALYGHPLGVLAELVIPQRQSQDYYTAFSPVESLCSEQMVRLWVGLHYRRVPLVRLVQPAQAIEFAVACLSQTLDQVPMFQWPSESEQWRTRISPEDDIYDPLEPLTRVSSQTPTPSDELYERLKANYQAVGLAAHAIHYGKRP